MYKIAIIEDEVNIQEELKVLLENARYEVYVVKNYAQGVQEILVYQPDLVLMDVNLPGTSGLSLCSQLRQESQVPVIFVTSCNTAMDELTCITMGGDDYIAKPYNVPVLLARIAAVLKRCAHKEEQESSLEHKGLKLDIASAKITHQKKSAELTRNELKILTFLLKNKGKITNRVDIIDYLWDNEVFIDDNTLSVNITRIRGKLKEIGLEDYIETKRGMGYLV